MNIAGVTFLGGRGGGWNHYVTQQHKSVIELVILFTLCLAIDYVYVVVKMIKMAKLMKTNFDTSELKTRRRK